MPNDRQYELITNWLAWLECIKSSVEFYVRTVKLGVSGEDALELEQTRYEMLGSILQKVLRDSKQLHAIANSNTGTHPKFQAFAGRLERIANDTLHKLDSIREKQSDIGRENDLEHRRILIRAAALSVSRFNAHIESLQTEFFAEIDSAIETLYVFRSIPTPRPKAESIAWRITPQQDKPVSTRFEFRPRLREDNRSDEHDQTRMQIKPGREGPDGLSTSLYTLGPGLAVSRKGESAMVTAKMFELMTRLQASTTVSLADAITRTSSKRS